MDAPSLLSRESTTLSFSNPQNGHFMLFKRLKTVRLILAVFSEAPKRSEGSLPARQVGIPIAALKSTWNVLREILPLRRVVMPKATRDHRDPFRQAQGSGLQRNPTLPRSPSPLPPNFLFLLW